MQKYTVEMISRLQQIGITTEDAFTLRRIAMTLHRWHELECGNGNSYASWCITRGRKYNGSFEHDDNGPPFIEHHANYEGGRVTYDLIPDRERGAKRRLAKIMANYPTLKAYIQTDPRGAPLYILPSATDENNYNLGVAVHK